jgi:hypothetical protein
VTAGAWECARDEAPYLLQAAVGGEWAFVLPDGSLGCSARDPAAEARRRCAGLPPGSRPLLLGLGAGHDLDALLAAGRSGVLAVEADARSLATTRERWRRMGRAAPDEASCALLFAPGDGELCGLLAELLADEHGERPVLAHPRAPELWRSAAPRAAELLEDLGRRRSSARRQEALLAENARNNRPRLLETPGVAELAGVWGAATVVVCGAGPGLEADLPMLAATRDLRLVAASTALPPMHAAGLVPDAVVATDPSPLLARDLPDSNGMEHVPLAVFPGASAELVDAWPGPLWLALPGGPGLREESWEGRRPGQLPGGCGTVAGPALALAALLSAGPLRLSGVDLSADGAVYAGGVRRPPEQQRPDFRYARRRMVELVVELRRAGRQVAGFQRRPDWLPFEEN